MATIDYSSGSRVVNERPHTVYTKSVWTDEWTAQPNMSCYECLWTAAPNINTARLRWEIGNVILPGDSLPTTIGVWVGRGQFVMVDWLCDDGTTILRWVGFIDSTSRPSEAFGYQEIVAYGLERSLALTTISRSVWWDDISDEIRVSQVAFPFNGPTGLRSDVTQEFGDEDVYLFADQNKVDFETLTTYATPWSTREIVRYLLTQMLPTSDLGVSVIPWTIVGLDLLPDWDSPRVDTEYRTVWDILNELVNAQRLLGFTCGNDGSDAVTIKFFTHLASDLTISGNTIPANTTQHTLITQPDALTNAYYADITGGYDQVICRGAKKQVIYTIGYFEDDVAYGGLVHGWKNTELTAYKKGASLESGYSDLSDAKKREANARARRSAKVSHVFKRFIANSAYSITTLGWQILRILPRLPIKPGSDWSGAVNPEHFDRDGEGIEPVLSFAMPGTDDVDARILSTAFDSLPTKPKKSFALKLTTKGRSVFIDVVGAEQHIIAAGTFGFTPLPVDPTDYPFIDQLTIHLTAAFEIDQHVEGSYPETAPTANIVRRLIVDAGPEYKHIEIINQGDDGELKTVAGVDSFAYETFSDGGILVDDTEKLTAIARFIAQSYALTRQSVSWQSQRKIGGVSVGDLITTGDGSTINSPVMAISINGGVSINRPAAATVQSFETYRGGSDPHALIVSMKAQKKFATPAKNLPQRIVDTGAKRVSSS